jgi:hypothetical protein
MSNSGLSGCPASTPGSLLGVLKPLIRLVVIGSLVYAGRKALQRWIGGPDPFPGPAPAPPAPAPVEQAPAEQAPVETAPIETAPVAKAPVAKAAAKKAAAKKAPAKKPPAGAG